ncbi:major facilitator superfamily domain-containing protein [Lenzites betulinus]|nr:major facilitator superfamily domain-containing protein [Lenzites betulinus]
MDSGYSEVPLLPPPASTSSASTTSTGSDDFMYKASLDSANASVMVPTLGLERVVSAKAAQDERAPSPGAVDLAPITTYRLYKRRWVGLFAICILNLVAGMVLVWFGPIANDVVRDFGYTLDEVNWLGNVVNLVYLPASFLVPYLYGKLGTRVTCYIGGALFIISGWFIAGMAVPIFQIVVPSYSEKWFDLKGRTTATMIMGVDWQLLTMAIIFSAAAPVVLFVGNGPPTPPTFSGSQQHPSMTSLARALSGRATPDEYTYMSMRQRIDFAIIALVFGVLVGVSANARRPSHSINAFTVLTAQHLEPYGYSDTVSGLMGAVLLLVGLIAAGVTSPLYDRILTHRLALSLKVLCPIFAACWIALIWEIRPDNTYVLFVLMGVIGAIGLTLLPAVLELAVELTRNADGSSAILWASTNACGLIFVVVEGALRAGPDASPPLNMHQSAIFQASIVATVILLVFLIEGKQTRRAQDEEADRARNSGSVGLLGQAESGTAVEVREVVEGGSARSSAEIQPVSREVADRKDA